VSGESWVAPGWLKNYLGGVNTALEYERRETKCGEARACLDNASARMRETRMWYDLAAEAEEAFAAEQEEAADAG